MQAFLAGLQFLTRIHLAAETAWPAERFGQSVKYFPLVGAVIGGLLAGAAVLGTGRIPPHVLAALLAGGGIWITGGLHCDGFMDTMDGLFSGRPRDAALTIMKDSRVGAHGVTAFCLLLLLKWSALIDMPAERLPAVLFLMPVWGRMVMVTAICRFPYARPAGIGKSFACYAGQGTLAIAALFTLALTAPFGWPAAGAAAASLLPGLAFAWYASRFLGGLTGDVYGAVTELTELSLCLAFLA